MIQLTQAIQTDRGAKSTPPGVSPPQVSERRPVLRSIVDPPVCVCWYIYECMYMCMHIYIYVCIYI